MMVMEEIHLECSLGCSER